MVTLVSSLTEFVLTLGPYWADIKLKKKQKTSIAYRKITMQTVVLYFQCLCVFAVS